MSSCKILPLAAASLLLLAACQNDGKTSGGIDQNLLTGRWELSEAWRNAKPTETLTGTFYEFTAEGVMRTNLTASLIEEEHPFEVSGRKIIQQSDPPVDYTVEALRDSTLVMAMQIQETPFRLTLKKAAPPAEAAQPQGDSL